MKANLDDRRWAEDWLDQTYNEWLTHCLWAKDCDIIPTEWVQYLYDHIVANLVQHKRTKYRNRRMRHVIVESYESLNACELIQQLDLNA